MSSRRYLLRRTLQTVLLLWVILTFLFFFIRLLPGDFIGKFVIQGMSPGQVRAIEQRWGLDQPLYVQYWRFLVNYVQLDVGTSLSNGRPVLDVVRLRIFNSFILVAPAITTVYVLGSILGGLMGNARGSRLERYGLLPIIFLGSFPEFITGILMIIMFAGILDWFPASGMVSTSLTIALGPDAAWWRPYLTTDFLWHYVLPFTVIVLRYLYFPTLLMRTNVVEVKGQDFFFYHRITGLPYVARLYHLFMHASLPVLTMYPLSVTQALGGLVIVETVFNWPGVGYLLLQSVFDRNFPVVIFILFLIGTFVIVANFVVDLVYSLVDPRIELG